MFIKLYLIALPVFLIIDFIWLGLIARNFYQEQIGALMKTNVNWTAAVLFYLIFILGMVTFVISPAVAKDSWVHALLLGALFGFVCYATYDLTNLALTKDWPILVTIIDLIWGGVLAGSVSIITFFIAKQFSF